MLVYQYVTPHGTMKPISLHYVSYVLHFAVINKWLTLWKGTSHLHQFATKQIYFTPSPRYYDLVKPLLDRDFFNQHMKFLLPIYLPIGCPVERPSVDTWWQVGPITSHGFS